MPISNDAAPLTPQIPQDGATLQFNFPGVRVGVAEYAEGPTGCTVFHFPQSALVATDVRGGLPGVFMAGDGPTDAICFAGGSLYGLEACTGVAAELLALHKYSVENMMVVRGAIIYDYPARENTIYPDKTLGRAALKAAREGVFPIGQRGAGISTGVGAGFDWSGGEPGGQGAAFRELAGTKILMCTVVNAIGAVVNRTGAIVRGHFNQKTGQREHLIDQIGAAFNEPPTDRPTKNTTLTLLLTNQKLMPQQLTQFGRQVHSSMARAIQPFHTGFDGDTLFAVTTNEVENETLPTAALGAVAAEVAWDAVLSAVGAHA